MGKKLLKLTVLKRQSVLQYSLLWIAVFGRFYCCGVEDKMLSI